MASSTTADKTRSPKTPRGGEWVEYDQFIDRQIRKTRGQVKGVEIASALMALATGAVAFFLLAALLDHWVFPHGLGFWGRLVCLAIFLAGAGYYAAEKLLPWLIYRINPIYAAQTIEKSRPTLKNSLINFLFLRSQSAPVSAAVYRAVEQQAATGLSRVAVESAVDRSRLIHVGYALLAAVGLFAAYFLFSPKNPWDTVGRVIMPWANIQVPTRVEILDVQPGTRTVFRGETVDVSAEIRGLNGDEPVRVLYSTADHEAVDKPVTMYLPGDRFRHSAKIPAADGVAQQSAGVQQDIDYRIEAGDAVSPTYHLKAVTAPTIALESIDYQYPNYTGRAPITLKGIGDIQSLEGTRVVIHGRANQAIKSAQLELDGRQGRTKSPMQIGDDGRSVSGSFTLALDEQDRTTPQFSHYRLRPEGDEQPEPVQYRIDVIPDLPPEVKFIVPEKDEVALPVNGRLKLKLRALDPDFALSELTLSAESNRRSVLEKRLLSEIRREPMQVDFVIDPAKLHLNVGDLLEYWATANDNRMPTPNTTQTARRRIRIVAAGANQGDPNQAQGDGQEGNQADQSNDPNAPNNKTAADKKSPSDNPNQDQPPAGKPTGDNAPQGKSPTDRQKADKPDGAENQQDAAQDHHEEKPSKDQPQPEKDGTAKKQDPSQQQKPNGGQDSHDKQNSGDKQESSNTNSGDKQKDGGEKSGGQKSPQRGGKSSEKSDSDKSGANNKSGGGNSGDNKSAGDKATGEQQKNGGAPQDKGGRSSEKPAGSGQPNADQSNQRPASDGSDDAEALKRIAKLQQENAKDGSQSDPQQPPDGQKQPGDRSSAENPQQTPAGEPSKSADAKKPADGQKPGDPKSGDESSGNKTPGSKSDADKSKTDKPNGDKPNGDKANGEKSNGEQPSTKEGDAGKSDPAAKPGAQKQGADKAAGDKADGANSPNEQAPPAKPSGGKSENSKSGDKSDKSAAEKNRPSDPGQNKSGNGDKPDQGKGERTKDGSQPTGDKHDAQQDKKPSDTKAGDPDSDKGAAGAGQDTAKDDKAAPPSPQDANKPTDRKNQQPKSEGKKDMQGKDEGKSPTSSPRESDSQGDQDGDRSGGGRKGGGQSSNQPGTGGAGKNTASDQGNGVSQGHGQGDTSKQAGADKASDHRTGQSGNEKGPGSHTKATNSEHADSPNSSQSPDDAGKQSAPSPQGSPSKNSKGPSGPGGSGYEPTGGSGSSTPPTGPPPTGDNPGDPANPAFAKKQFDMALESLKKGEPDLLKELNWTPEEAQKLAERLERMRRNAEASGPKGDEARRQMDDLLRSLGSRSGQLDRRGGSAATDTQRGLRESHDAGPPPEYSEQVEAFQKGILQGGK
jgi:hypothetical protein